MDASIRFEQMHGAKGPMPDDFNITLDGVPVATYHKNRFAKPGTDSATVRDPVGRVAIVPDEQGAVRWLFAKAQQDNEPADEHLEPGRPAAA